ncbi:MAG: hypothetical protein ACLRMG_01270 [Clostridium sp.]
MMKYKIGDRVKVRSDLTSSKLYDGYGVVDKMIRKILQQLHSFMMITMKLKKMLSAGQMKCLKDWQRMN